MKTELITPPAELPVTSDDLRSHLWTVHDGHSSAEYLELLIKAATSHIEQITWRKLVQQEWRVYLQSWPNDTSNVHHDCVMLPFGSVLSVDAVRWLDSDGVDHLIDAGDYIAAVAGSEPMVVPLAGWPSGDLFAVDPIRVNFTAGFGDAAAVPDDLKHAVRLLAAHWYEVREAVMVGTTVRKVPFAVDALIAPWKVRYFR